LLQDLLSKFLTPADKQGYLTQLTAAHPYFAPAQFCLLQTLQPGSEAFNHRAAIVHLLYNNAHWLQYQLAQGNTNSTSSNETLPVTAAATDSPTEVQDTLEEVPAPAHEEATPEATVSHTDNETATPRSIEADISDMMTDTTVTPEQDTLPTDTATATTDNTAVPLFEPLFAVDYFASQGIKLSEDIQPGDKLGHQLKSFTEWLKSLKKNNEPLPESIAVAAEAAVQTIAEKSNAEDDVVTEAMAEVFALQGRRQKATEIYRKLSLLNPHKSAYFAAKIENLK